MTLELTLMAVPTQAVGARVVPDDKVGLPPTVSSQMTLTGFPSTERAATTTG
jgi:hypothetical protein